MIYHSTKQALLSAFDLRGLMYQGMKWDYEQDYKTVNLYTVEPSSFDERLGQDAALRHALRDVLSEREYLTLMFCYTLDGRRLYDTWIGAVKPSVIECSKLAGKLSAELLLPWVFDKFTRTKFRYGNHDIEGRLEVTRKTVYNNLTKPVTEAMAVNDIEDKASQIINAKGWFINSAA